MRSQVVDRISSLSCDLLEKILGCLPLKDAVRTSVLSREWRYKWVVRSELVFDFNINKGLETKNIHQILLIHQGPLRKFSLITPNSVRFPDIDQWILFLSKKNVREFSLRFPRHTDCHLPSHIFKFQDLRHLELCRYKLHPPPDCKAFSRLVTLNFLSVTFQPASFHALLASSPLLERATLKWCTPFDNFIVDAPRLKFFEFVGEAESICSINTPLLEEIIMTINFYIFKPFTAGLRVSQVILHNIKILNFQYFNFSCDKGVSYLLNLINSCPNLERLVIASYAAKIHMDPVVHLLRAQGMPHSALKQLKRVDMKFIQVHEPEIEFLKYVLSVATALEKVCVQTFVGFYFKEVYEIEREKFMGMKMMEKMKQFSRASPKVEFIYEEVYHIEPGEEEEFWTELTVLQCLNG